MTVGLWKPTPAPALAADEEQRAENVAARIVEISDHPGHPQHRNLHHFQAAARLAFETAARYTEQPKRGERP